MVGPRFRTAGWFWSTVLERAGYLGVFTPWGTIYLLPHYASDRRLQAHEWAHAMQRERDGYFRFWFLIFYYAIRHGYWDSPYEVEARAIAQSIGGRRGH